MNKCFAVQDAKCAYLEARGWHRREDGLWQKYQGDMIRWPLNDAFFEAVRNEAVEPGRWRDSKEATAADGG